jgi:hypothetical protein
MTWQEAYERVARRFREMGAIATSRWLYRCARVPPRSPHYPFEWNEVAEIARDLARLTGDQYDQELARQVEELRDAAWRALDGG